MMYAHYHSQIQDAWRGLNRSGKMATPTNCLLQDPSKLLYRELTQSRRTGHNGAESLAVLSLGESNWLETFDKLSD
jgi:hypothetical protein